MGKVITIGNWLSKAFDRILTVTGYASGTIIVIMMLSMSYEVMMRYFFLKPTPWAADFSGYMQYAIVLLGAAYVLKIDAHTKIDTILMRFPSKTRTVINIVTSLLAMVTCALFFWKGMEATWSAYIRGDFLYREVEIPIAPLYAFIPFAFLLLFIQFGRRVYSFWHSLSANKTD